MEPRNTASRPRSATLTFPLSYTYGILVRIFSQSGQHIPASILASTCIPAEVPAIHRCPPIHSYPGSSRPAPSACTFWAEPPAGALWRLVMQTEKDKDLTGEDFFTSHNDRPIVIGGTVVRKRSQRQVRAPSLGLPCLDMPQTCSSAYCRPFFGAARSCGSLPLVVLGIRTSSEAVRIGLAPSFSPRPQPIKQANLSYTVR